MLALSSLFAAGMPTLAASQTRPTGEPAGDVTTMKAVRVMADDDSEAYTRSSTNSSTGLNLSLRQTPQSVSIMTSQRIRDQNLTQLTDVAAQTPGLSINASGNIGSDSSPIYSRGFAIDNYMIDGVRLLSSYSSIFQSQDMALYEQVEIIRGGTGLMNGAGSPGGAINLIRKKPTEDFQASGTLEFGSWDYRRVDADVSMSLNRSGSVRGRLVASVQDAESYIDRLEEDRNVYYGVIEADVIEGMQVLAGFSQQRHDSTGHARGGLPAYYSDGTRTRWSRSASAAPTWSYSERHSTSMFLQMDHLFSNEWEFRASLSRTITDSDELVGYAGGGNPVRATGAGVNIWATHWEYKPTQDVVDLKTNGSFGLFGREHDLVVGLTVARADYRSPSYTNWTHAGWSSAVPNIYTWDGTAPAAPPNPAIGTHASDDRNDGAYASVRLRPSDRLSVILGARFSDWARDQRNYRFSTNITTRTNREESELTPYAGVVFDYSEHWSAYTSFTTIFQPQNFRTVSGEYIDPLAGDSFEAGVKGAYYDNRLNVSGAVFQTMENNKAIAIPGVFAPDGSQAYEGFSGTRTRGIEAEVAGQVLPGWELSASVSRNMTEDRRGARLNTAVPQNTAKLFTTYLLPHVGNGLVIGGGVRWQSEIYQLNTGPNRVRFTQDSYAIVDLLARYHVTPSVTASLNVNNVLDKYYFNSVGNSYYGAPRAIRFAVNVGF